MVLCSGHLATERPLNYMKKIFKIITINIIILVWSNLSNALNFQELEKYNKENSGTVSGIYMFQRCSAIAHFYYLKLKKEGSNSAIINKKVSDEFFLLAEIFYQKYNDTSEKIAKDKTLKSIKEMIILYEEDAEEMRIKNGLEISGIILNDHKFCSALYKRVNHFLSNEQKG